MWTYPHSISYFNEFVGGPRKGHEHLIDSNFAWGQDVQYLKKWRSSHPTDQPFYCAYFGSLDPAGQGLSYQAPPERRVVDADHETMESLLHNLPPGWYAIDANFLHHPFLRYPTGSGTWSGPTATNRADLRYFRKLAPVGSIAYSYLLYHVPGGEPDG
jgi:hypothetical protein